MGVALVQFAPELGQPEKNMKKVDKMLKSYSASSRIQLLVLPEMAFSGYTFRDEAEILPLAEDDEGPTTKWCIAQAQRLGCVVCCGYPRRKQTDQGTKLYNSAVVVLPDGTVTERYDKHFLYVTDKTWSQEGTEFKSLQIDSLGCRLGLGICMDINPYEFKAPFTDFELANFHKASGSKIIAFCSNWCNCHPDDPPAAKKRVPPALETIQYWLSRLEPLIGQDVFFVAANRVGKEPLAPLGKDGATTFVGASCTLSLKKPHLIGSLNNSEEKVLVVEVPS
eukprot:NODE_1111_length_997_cov_167.838608_g921_i0.p1 GENE.NODE_1111_length_997_cov_167.838608_g921_i0~~NODE_1111_length_997_cov_167.838608_g921_i0.p1  ORF type:complete len:287 (-),score=56.73 NODE_1111_length_997_cov_167.838608_g921_i0:137-976(-)